MSILGQMRRPARAAGNAARACPSARQSDEGGHASLLPAFPVSTDTSPAGQNRVPARSKTPLTADPWMASVINFWSIHNGSVDSSIR